MGQGKKYNRNQRLIYLTNYLINHPHELTNLSHFTSHLNCAKSSISEDIHIVKGLFDQEEIGTVQTVSGVNGGVIYHPRASQEEISGMMAHVTNKLRQGRRILPGNYIYINDIIQDPYYLDLAGKIIASKYQARDLDVILTIEVKGIGLAASVARYLNIPYVVARRQSRADEGPEVVVNYVSGSHQTLEEMVLSKRSLQAGDRVLIVDDFIRNGGTLNGLVSLLEEFDCRLGGICIFGENVASKKQSLPDYQSLVNVQIVYNEEIRSFELQVDEGSFFEEVDKSQ